MKHPIAVDMSNSSLNPQYSAQKQLIYRSYEYKKEGRKENGRVQGIETGRINRHLLGTCYMLNIEEIELQTHGFYIYGIHI